MAYKPKAPPVMAAPNVIPMADIMLVLLIIFMVIIPMLQHGQAVNMAKATNVDKFPDAEKEDAVIVAITRDGRYFLSPGNKQITLDDVTNDVRDLLTDRQDKTVYVRADERAHYGDVVKAVDEIRSAGVENLGLLTDQIPPKNVPGAPPPASGSD
ncbi:MAG TPA: biopolymer transporter ExbD [Candidatus Binatia bacterium]|nr:biopolymer transporter ExbD [Candidatus Binatia bacterium]